MTKPYSIENRAKKYYGLTDRFQLAGYLLTDGTMLNFSDEGYQRDQDHRNIGYFYKKASGNNALRKFLKRGNIRIMCHGKDYNFEYYRLPTKEQFQQLQRAYFEFLRNMNTDSSFCIEKEIHTNIYNHYAFETFCNHISKYVDYKVTCYV